MNLDEFLLEAHAGIRIPRKPELMNVDATHTVPDTRAALMSTKLTLQQILDCVATVTDFGLNLSHETAMAIQQDINNYNGRHNIKICILMGVDEGGYRWHLWGPDIDVYEREAAGLAIIFRSRMTKLQRQRLDQLLTSVDPWLFYGIKQEE